jgi:hypothetical protein
MITMMTNTSIASVAADIFAGIDIDVSPEHFPKGGNRWRVLSGISRGPARKKFILAWIDRGILPPEAEALIDNPPCSPRGCPDEDASAPAPRPARTRRKNARPAPEVHSGVRVKQPPRTAPCVHFGERVSTIVLSCCGGKTRDLPIYECREKWEQCVAGASEEGVHGCHGCREYEPPTEATE